jgi:hypothetical protein
MRGSWVALGIVLLAVGVVLWYLPVSMAVGSTVVPALGGDIVHDDPTLAVLTPTVAYSSTWASSSGASVVVDVYNCGADSSCSNFTSPTPVASGHGSSGSLSWSGGKGDYYAIIPMGITQSTTVSVSVAQPLGGGFDGLGVVIIGVFVVFLGAIRRAQPHRGSPLTSGTNGGGSDQGAA